MIGIELRSIVAFISLCVSLGCTPYYREAQSPSAIVFQPAETTAGIHPPPAPWSIMNLWIDCHISEVIKESGAHTRAVSDGNGGTVYVWAKTYHSRLPSPATLPHPDLLFPRERESDRWIVSPRPFGEYEIKRAPQTRSGVLSAIRDIVELEAYQRAVRPPDLPQSRYQTVAIFADANGKVYWWRVDDNGAIYDHGPWKRWKEEYGRHLKAEDR